VNFEVIKAMILGQRESVVNVHKEHKFKRKRKADATVAIVKEHENKRYMISFFK
jgi:ribosomal protein L31E